MTHQERDRLFAVALDAQRGSRSGNLSPSEVNLSEFLRQAVFKIVSAYEHQVGVLQPERGTTEDKGALGAMTLLQQLRNAELVETEAEAARAARAAEEARAVQDRAELGKVNPPLGNFAELRIGGNA